MSMKINLRSMLDRKKYNLKASLEARPQPLKFKPALEQLRKLTQKYLKQGRNSHTTKSQNVEFKSEKNKQNKFLPDQIMIMNTTTSNETQPHEGSRKLNEINKNQDKIIENNHVIADVQINNHSTRQGLQTASTTERDKNLKLIHGDRRENKYKDILDGTMIKNISQKVSTKYIEQWLNDTLKECEDLDIPGTLSKPEHKQPLSRYNMDRMFLTNTGISISNVNRLYSSLFVYSLGFFSVLDDCTITLENERVITQARIWKVYQILLEYCCKTDYRLITHEIEKMNQAQADEAEAKFRDAIVKLEQSETYLKTEVRRLQSQYDEIMHEKNEERNQKSKLMKDFQDTSKKHEEEVQLRLFFESKLNSLHHLNREMTLKLKNLKMKYSEQVIKNQDFTAENKQLKDNLDSANAKIEILDKQVEDLTMRYEYCLEDKLRIEKKLYQVEQKFNVETLRLDKTLHDLDHAAKEKERMILDLQNNKNYLKTKVTETSNVESYLKEMQSRTEDQEVELNQFKMKEDRLRKKLSFYKQQYMNFELQIKGLEDQLKKSRQEHRLEKNQSKNLKEQILKLEMIEIDQEKYIQTQKNEIGDINTRANIVLAARRDLEEKLKLQIDQSTQLIEKNSELDEEIRQLKQIQNRLEYNLQESENQNSSLEQKVQALQFKIETLMEKINDTKTNLRLEAAHERDSREGWKDRYDQENKALKLANKTLNNQKSEISELKIKVQVKDKEVQETLEQKQALEVERDSLLDKYSEALGNLERLEREIYTKKIILDRFDQDKKIEMKEILKKIADFQRKEQQYEIYIEDILSDLLRQIYSKNLQTDQISQLNQTIQELTQQLSYEQSLYNQIQEEKQVVEDALKETNQKLTSQQENNLNLKGDIESLTEIKNNQEQQISLLQSSISDNEKQLTNLREEVQTIKTENDNYKEKFKIQKDKNEQKVEREIQVTQIQVEDWAQTDLTFEKKSGRMVVYNHHAGINSLDRMRTYSSREDLELDNQRLRNLQPKFKKQSIGGASNHLLTSSHANSNSYGSQRALHLNNRPMTGMQDNSRIIEEGSAEDYAFTASRSSGGQFQRKGTLNQGEGGSKDGGLNGDSYSHHSKSSNSKSRSQKSFVILPQPQNRAGTTQNMSRNARNQLQIMNTTGMLLPSSSNDYDDTKNKLLNQPTTSGLNTNTNSASINSRVLQQRKFSLNPNQPSYFMSPDKKFLNNFAKPRYSFIGGHVREAAEFQRNVIGGNFDNYGLLNKRATTQGGKAGTERPRQNGEIMKNDEGQMQIQGNKFQTQTDWMIEWMIADQFNEREEVLQTTSKQTNKEKYQFNFFILINLYSRTDRQAIIEKKEKQKEKKKMKKLLKNAYASQQ